MKQLQLLLLCSVIFVSGCTQANVVKESSVDVRILQDSLLADNVNTPTPTPTKVPLNEPDKHAEIPECPDSVMDCSDSSVARCKNKFLDSSCTLCKPDCPISKPPPTPITTATPTPAPIINHIILTEVFYDTPGTDSEEEFVEIYNPTVSSVNLLGWGIQDNSENIWRFPDIGISPYTYLRIARDSAGFQNLFGCAPDIDTLTRSLANSGGRAILKDSFDNEVDFVAWEGGKGGAYPEWTIEASGQSIARGIVDTDSPDDWRVEEPSAC
jgi:hypothetical protein